MAGVPLASLVERARVAANMQVGGPFDPGDWEAAINDGVAAFYVTCTAAMPSWRVSRTNLVITDTATPYAAVPADFSAVYRLVRDAGTPQRREIYTAGDERPGERTYRLEGTNIWIDPAEDSVGTYELRYNPVPVVLDAATNLDPELAQHRQYFELYAAISALSSEESSTASLDGMFHGTPAFKGAVQRAEEWARRQRKTEGQRPRDVRPRRGLFGR